MFYDVCGVCVCFCGFYLIKFATTFYFIFVWLEDLANQKSKLSSTRLCVGSYLDEDLV